MLSSGGSNNVSGDLLKQRPMLQPENLSLAVLLGVVIVFVGLILLPVEIVVEEKLPQRNEDTVIED